MTTITMTTMMTMMTTLGRAYATEEMEYVDNGSPALPPGVPRRVAIVKSLRHGQKPRSGT